eukprot:6584134-Prymnesium_polylepis.3
MGRPLLLRRHRAGLRMAVRRCAVHVPRARTHRAPAHACAAAWEGAGRVCRCVAVGDERRRRDHTYYTT